MPRYVKFEDVVEVTYQQLRVPSNQQKWIDMRDALWEIPTADVREVMSSAWIPVTERLPEVYAMYLVTLDDGSVYFLYWEWDDEFKHWVDTDGNSDYIVVAWMPLPESFKPYRGDE